MPTRYLLLTALKVCDWPGHIFGASAGPRSLTKKTGYVAFFHCSWQSAWYQICDIRVANACGIRGWRSLGFYAWTSSYAGGVLCYINGMEKSTTERTFLHPLCSLAKASLHRDMAPNINPTVNQLLTARMWVGTQGWFYGLGFTDLWLLAFGMPTDAVKPTGIVNSSTQSTLEL